jgi:Tfp pilus assembly protein PilO
MRTRHAARLWILAGAVAAAAIVAVTALVLVPTLRTDTDALREQAGFAEVQAAKLRGTNARLAADQANIGKLTSEVQALTTALPADSGVPVFLRQLQATGTAVGVDVSGLTVGAPEADKNVTGVWALRIQLTADGSATQLDRFLDRLQGSAGTRAVLIETANLTESAAGPDSTAPRMTLNLNIKAFVAPPAGAGAPTVTAN